MITWHHHDGLNWGHRVPDIAPPYPKMNGAAQLAVFLCAAAACSTPTLWWMPSGTGVLSSTVHKAEANHVHSWDAIKSHQADPWDVDEKRREGKEGGGSLPFSNLWHCVRDVVIPV